MKPKLVTEKHLQENAWWWRTSFTNRPSEARFHSSLAFNYELVRRVYRTKRLVPFPSLKAPYIEIILGLSDDSHQEMTMRPATEAQRQNEPGWTHEIHLQWNLNIPDLTLQRAFLDLIHRERAFQGIAKPRPNAGKRKRPLAWRWLELMDLADLSIRPLNGNERSSLSEARARAKQRAEIFTAAIDAFLEAKRTMTNPTLVNWVNIFQMGGATGWKGVWPRE